MIYNFDAAPDRQGTESFKWTRFDRDVLPMWVADMDFVSPEPVLRALQERVAHGVFGYPGDLPGLAEAIVERLARLYGWQVTPADLVLMPGVVTGLNMAAHAFLRPGESLLIQPPVYMPFLSSAQYAGGLTQPVPLTLDSSGYYSVDMDAFESAISPQARLFMLCNPHNPVGRVFTPAELEGMAQVCLRNNLVICSDEIHCDLVYSGHRHSPIATFSPEIAQKTITLMAPSKTFNIAGLGCSFAVIQNPDLRRQFKMAGKGLVHFVNLLGLVAARAAYQEGQEWLDQLLAYLEGNRAALVEFVREQLPAVSMFCPEGTYLAWLDCRKTGLGEKPGSFFLEKARVALNEGEAFGLGGEGFVRLNFGCPRPMLLEALRRMKTALEAV